MSAIGFILFTGFIFFYKKNEFIFVETEKAFRKETKQIVIQMAVIALFMIFWGIMLAGIAAVHATWFSFLLVLVKYAVAWGMGSYAALKHGYHKNLSRG